MAYCQSITEILIIIWVRCVPLNLSLKTGRRATLYLELLLSIERNGQLRTSLCTTNMTISTSILQTFRSWVAIFPSSITSLWRFYLTTYESGATLYKLLGQEYVRERLKSSLSGSSMVIMGKHYIFSLSQMLHAILGHYHIQWHPPLMKHVTKLWPYYRLSPYHQIPGSFHRTFETGAASEQRALLLQTPGPVQFGICIWYNVESQRPFSPEFFMFPDFEFRISLGAFIFPLPVFRATAEELYTCTRHRRIYLKLTFWIFSLNITLNIIFITTNPYYFSLDGVLGVGLLGYIFQYCCVSVSDKMK